MRATRSIGFTNNLSSSLINYNLGFESMAFFLTTIVAALFFLGVQSEFRSHPLQLFSTRRRFDIIVSFRVA